MFLLQKHTRGRTVRLLCGNSLWEGRALSVTHRRTQTSLTRTFEGAPATEGRGRLTWSSPAGGRLAGCCCHLRGTFPAERRRASGNCPVRGTKLRGQSGTHSVIPSHAPPDGLHSFTPLHLLSRGKPSPPHRERGELAGWCPPPWQLPLMSGSLGAGLVAVDGPTGPIGAPFIRGSRAR